MDTLPPLEKSVPMPMSEPLKELKEKRSIGMLALIGLVFLLPLFFIPFTQSGLVFGKALLFSFAVLGIFIVSLGRELRTGELRIPLNIATIAAAALPLVYLLSALITSPSSLSFFGQGYEVDTVFTVFLLFLAFFLTASLARTRGNIVYLLVAFFSSFVLIILFQVVRLLAGADVLSFGIFTTMPASPVGKWNDLAILCGSVVLFVSLAIEHLSIRGRLAWLLWGALTVSLAFLAIVNFMLVWVVLGILTSVFILYTFSSRFFNWRTLQRERRPLRRIPFAMLLIFIVTLVFMADAYLPQIFGSPRSPIGSAIVNSLHLTQLEARPSWGTTFSIAKVVYAKQPLFGSGPNSFWEDWLLHKPDSINQTIFWNTLFASGIGFIPTAFITTGIVGGLAWLFFLVALLLLGWRAFHRVVADSLDRFLLLATFIVSVFLWFFAIIYVPSTTLMMLAAVFSGAFIALLGQTGILPLRELVFSKHPKMGFAATLLLIVLLIVSIVGLYAVGRKFVAAVYFDKAAQELAAENLDSASNAIHRALIYSNTDRFHQVAAQVAIAQIGSSLASNANPEAEERDRLRTLAEGAIGEALAATNDNSHNFYNWITLGQVYESLARLQTTNAYENAVAAYDKAEALSPSSPAIPLARARLEAARGYFDKARKQIEVALQKKNDYTAPILLLAQIEIAEGNTNQAIVALVAAARTSPTNPLIFFQLGFLEYSIHNYKLTISALEQAVSLAENYSNARYFLGLAYFKEGRVADAIAQFERILALNPDNTEVAQILLDLRAGKDPTTGKVPPEKRENPPLDQ